jgi:hypothetical protein
LGHHGTWGRVAVVHGRDLTLTVVVSCSRGCSLNALARRGLVGDATVVVKPKRLVSAGKAGSRGAQLSTAAATGRCTRTGPEMGASRCISGVVRGARVWGRRRGES